MFFIKLNYYKKNVLIDVAKNMVVASSKYQTKWRECSKIILKNNSNMEMNINKGNVDRIRRV